MNMPKKKVGLDIETQIYNKLSKDVNTQRDVRKWLDSILVKIEAINYPLYFYNYEKRDKNRDGNSSV